MKKTMIGSATAGVLLTVGLLLSVSCDRSFEARLGRPRPFEPDGLHGIESGKVFDLKGTSNTDFKVMFFGLIVVANTDTSGDPAKPRRAMLVEGKTGMLHEPLLIVDQPGDAGAQAKLEDALKDATGHTADCHNSKYRDSCVVNVAGVAMRIRDTDGKIATGTLGNDRSFSIVPSLKANATGTAAQKELKTGLVTQSLPATPVAAYFEIDGGGTLEACPFARGGNFGGGGTTACRQFASDVYWFGETAASKPAVLQLASKVKTDGSGNLDWKTIPVANTGRLVIAISNEPLIQPTGASTKHFDLFAKVLDGGGLPSITADCAPPTCPGACVTCNGPKVIVPGCSDSQWP